MTIVDINILRIYIVLPFLILHIDLHGKGSDGYAKTNL